METQVKYILKERKMTQKHLADQIGMSVQQLHNTISGRYPASITVLQKIAATLDVEFWQLFAPADVRRLYYDNKNKKPKPSQVKVEQVQHCPYCLHELHIQLK